MIKYYFKYEWIGLNRDRWVATIFTLFFVLTIFAVYNGSGKTRSSEAAISRSVHEMKALDKKYAAQIDSLATGLMPAPESWLDPRSLSVYGQRAPRVAYMDPSPLAIIAIGQSDLYTHQVKPKMYGEASALGFSELSNPVQLLFGSFDLAFVCIYLLPLVVLAFSYNVLSSEKEGGLLRLTASFPISVYTWLIGKMMLRFIIVVAVVLISITLAIIVNGVSLTTASADLTKLFIVISAYILFWFVLSLLVNLGGWSSGKNAVTLVSVWVIVVLLMPSVINQMANTLYPVPSRINMIHEYRVASAKAETQSDENLKSYYHDHPELAPKDSLTQNQYNWWLKHFASADMSTNAIKPLLDEYNLALEQQQKWVDRFRFASPAILLQNSMNELAATSPKHYANFRAQVIEFAGTWRNYFLPRMFNNENMKPEDLQSLPKFEYKTDQVPRTWTIDFAVMILYIGLLAGFGVWAHRRERLEQILA